MMSLVRVNLFQTTRWQSHIIGGGEGPILGSREGRFAGAEGPYRRWWQGEKTAT